MSVTDHVGAFEAPGVPGLKRGVYHTVATPVALSRTIDLATDGAAILAQRGAVGRNRLRAQQDR
jgi:hypothetical protein